MMIRKKTARAFPLLLAAVFVLSSGCSPAPPAAFEREETADVPAQREETILAEREETIPAEREETVPAGQEEAESEKASEEEGSVETEACSAVRLRTGEGDDVRIVLDAGCFLDFLSGKDGYTLQIGSEGGGSFRSVPARIGVIRTTYGQPAEAARGYDEIREENGEITATARVVSDAGSVFLFTDRYCPADGGVMLSRSVEVATAGEGDKGFDTEFRFGAEEGVAPEWFIPSLLYKDSDDIIETAAFSSATLDYEQNLVRETRCGLPMIMMRDPVSGFSAAMSHIADAIADTASPQAAGAPRRVDTGCRYGSLGIVGRRGSAQGMSYTYPFYEYPRVYGFSYDGREQSAACFHPVSEGERQEYRLFVSARDAEDYNGAMVASYLAAFAEQPVTVADEDTDQIYDICVRDLKDLFTQTTHGRGLPFAVFIDNGQIHSVSFQIGFIGMQTTLAHHMIRWGLANDDEDSVKKGAAILDFWARLAKTDSGAVKVWFDDTTFRRYPPFLRIMSDGMEGMLDAAMAARASGRDDLHADLWLGMAEKFADFLVTYQNEDGSFWRAYDYHGNAYKIGNPDSLVGDWAEIGGKKYDKTVGDSKVNTAVPVRFLIRMWELTGDERCKTAAVRAGDYVLGELYPTGRYVGGTPDNPNTVDKEAGVYALFAYSALYGATGEEKYLRASEQAAVFAMSWVYLYRFAVTNTDGLTAGRPAAAGCSDGLSLIATGHSAADSYMSVAYYEFFKLYVRTGETRWRDMALFLEKNTKQTMNVGNRWGFARESFMPEATNLAEFVFRTADVRGVWLPWITAVNAEPIAAMERTFGKRSVAQLQNTDLGVLREQLAAYGSGGISY